MPQTLFPILQWVTYDDLRVESAKFMAQLPTVWIAIWWLSVWESKEDMMRTLDVIHDHLPIDKPRYLMGIWTPEDLIEAIARWIDMFDCVLPTRIGRHGTAFSWTGNKNTFLSILPRKSGNQYKNESLKNIEKISGKTTDYSFL